MTLEEYLSAEAYRRKLLVAGSVSKGNELLRLYTAHTGRPVRNTVCVTLRELAATVYRFGMAATDDDFSARLLDDKAAAVLLRRVVLNLSGELQFFTEENMLTLPMAELLYRTAALLRANGWTGNEDDSDPKIRDLKRIIPAFEAALERTHQADDVLLMQTAASVVRGWENPSKTAHGLLGTQLACIKEDTEQLNNAEQDFLALLQQAINGETRSVSVFEDEPAPGTLPAAPTETAFFCGYGHYNEANYIANDIAKKNLAPGDVEVLFTSQRQLPAICAALRGNGIPAAVLSAAPAAGAPYLRLASRILDWAEADYSETALKDILASRLLRAPYTGEDEETHNAVGWTNYYQYILEPRNRFEEAYVLGWGYQRNRDFIEAETALAQEPRVLAALTLHTGLLDIFCTQEGAEYARVSPGVLYGKLEMFLNTFAKPSSAADAAGKGAFYQLRDAAAQEQGEMPLAEAIRFIRDLLDGAAMSDSSSDTAVSVRHVSDWRLSDRRHLYLIGLSFRDLQQSMTESPVLSDSELLTVLRDGERFTTSVQTRQQEKNLCRTIAGFSGERLTFGYSSFDADYFCESNPSILFRSLLQRAGKELAELPEFVYGSAATEQTFSPKYTDEPCPAPNGRTSKSRLERLLSCPKQYAFENLLRLSDEAPQEKDYGAWLDFAQTGTFFHKIAERYVSEALFLPTSADLPEQPDAERIAAITDEEYADLCSRIPATVHYRAGREKRDMQALATCFADWLLKQMREEGWRPLAVEQRFENSVLTVSDYADAAHSFTVSGAIDRIDYRLLPDEHKIELRVADYKTGSSGKKGKEDALGLLLQHIVYENALMVDGKYQGASLLQSLKERIAQREHTPELTRWDVGFAGFYYEFPRELSVYRPQQETLSLALTRLRAILTLIGQENRYPEYDTFVAALTGLSAAHAEDVKLSELCRKAGADLEKSNSTQDPCEYCAFTELCGVSRNRKGGA